MGLDNLIQVNLLVFIFTWHWPSLVITLAHKVQLFPFFDPFLVLQSPGTCSIPPASWLGLCCLFPAVQWLCYSITVLFSSLFACCWALSWVSQLQRCLSESQRSSLCMWVAQVGLCSGLEPLWSRPSPRSPVSVGHQTSITFSLLFQQANSHSLIKTSQTG